MKKMKFARAPLFLAALVSTLLCASLSPAATIDDNTFGKLGAILAAVYESEIEDINVSPYKFNMLGEDLDLYTAVCKNGRKCDLVVKSDGTVYINENEDTPNFKRVVIGNLIFIGEPVNDYWSDVDYDAFVQKISDTITVMQRGADAELGKAFPIDPDNELASLIIDHRKVRVYGISYEFDVGAFFAVDETTEYIYCAPGANTEEFFRCVYDYGKDAYFIGEQVSVQSPGM